MFKPHYLFFVLTLILNANYPSFAQTEKTAATTERDRATTLYRAGDYEQSVKISKGVVKKNKTDYLAWYLLGLGQVALQDFKDASKSFENTIRLNPEFALGHNGLAYSYLMRNKLSEAISEAEIALRIDPRLKDAHYAIGLAYLRMDETEKALARSETLLSIDPNFAIGYLLKSQALVGFSGSVITALPAETPEQRKLRYAEAEKALVRYLELNPKATDKQVWLEQLDSLRFHMKPHKEGAVEDRVYSGREVTTKARVVAKPEPSYTDAARASGISGTVILRCVFGSDGKVKHFVIVRGLPLGLSEQAIAAARRIKFMPAMVNGVPVSMFIQLEYNFNLY